MATFNALCAAIVANTTSSVVLFMHRFVDTDFDKLIDARKENTSVATIDLSFSGIDNTIASKLFSAISPNVTFLDVSYSLIGANGARALANVLKTNMSLVYVNISNNCIGDEGLDVLIDALATNTTVLSLAVGCGCGALKQKRLSELSTLCARNVAIDKTKRMILLARSALMRCLIKTHYDMIRAMMHQR